MDDNEDAVNDPTNSRLNCGMEGISALLTQFLPSGTPGGTATGTAGGSSMEALSRFLQQSTHAQQQCSEGAIELFSPASSQQRVPLPQCTPPILPPTFNPFLYAAYLQFQQIMASQSSSLHQSATASPLRAPPPPNGVFASPLALNVQKSAAEMASVNLQLHADGLHSPLLNYFPMLHLLGSPNSTPTISTATGESLLPSQGAPPNLLQIARLPDHLASMVGAFSAAVPTAPSHLTSPLSTDSETSSSNSVNTTTQHTSSCTTTSSPPSSVVPANISVEQPSSQQQSTLQLLPSNDKEGWCRNKKYIQVVKKGYKCLVCNKIYGRYNSVSYHVTIYHRNPPIKCEEEGCQFTTREARYIHFHKYYRHQIPLPGSIDLASRKCPLEGCKHVSKSPAMLDKHMHRHVTDSLKDGVYVCSDCRPPRQFPLHEELYRHLRDAHAQHGGADAALTAVDLRLEEKAIVGIKTERGDVVERPFEMRTSRTHSNDEDAAAASVVFPCGLCPYKSRTMESLEQHKLFKHSSLVFNLTAATGSRQGICGRQPPHHNALSRRHTADCIDVLSSSTASGETTTGRADDEDMELSEAKLPLERGFADQP